MSDLLNTQKPAAGGIGRRTLLTRAGSSGPPPPSVPG